MIAAVRYLQYAKNVDLYKCIKSTVVWYRRVRNIDLARQRSSPVKPDVPSRIFNLQSKFNQKILKFLQTVQYNAQRFETCAIRAGTLQLFRPQLHETRIVEMKASTLTTTTAQLIELLPGIL